MRRSAGEKSCAHHFQGDGFACAVACAGGAAVGFEAAGRIAYACSSVTFSDAGITRFFSELSLEPVLPRSLSISARIQEV